MTELKITQADRDAAASLALWLFDVDLPQSALDRIAERLRSGKADKQPSVQAFARHRIAAEEGKAELVEALERIEGATMSMYSKPADMVQDIKRMAAAALARVRGEG